MVLYNCKVVTNMGERQLAASSTNPCLAELEINSCTFTASYLQTSLTYTEPDITDNGISMLSVYNPLLQQQCLPRPFLLENT